MKTEAEIREAFDLLEKSFWISEAAGDKEQSFRLTGVMGCLEWVFDGPKSNHFQTLITNLKNKFKEIRDQVARN